MPLQQLMTPRNYTCCCGNKPLAGLCAQTEGVLQASTDGCLQQHANTLSSGHGLNPGQCHMLYFGGVTPCNVLPNNAGLTPSKSGRLGRMLVITGTPPHKAWGGSVQGEGAKQLCWACGIIKACLAKVCSKFGVKPAKLVTWSDVE